jgi:hypothetical protein
MLYVSLGWLRRLLQVLRLLTGPGLDFLNLKGKKSEAIYTEQLQHAYLIFSGLVARDHSYTAIPPDYS